MTKVLILGANGQLARNTTRVFLEKTDVVLRFYLRQASRLRNPDPARVKIGQSGLREPPQFCQPQHDRPLRRLRHIGPRRHRFHR